MKKVSIILLCAMIVVSAFASSIAESKSVQYTHIAMITAGLTINGGTATVSGSVMPKRNYRTSVTVNLQIELNDGTWSTVATWSGSNNAGYSEAGGTESVLSGESYRTYVIGYVYNSTGVVIDSATAYYYY